MQELLKKIKKNKAKLDELLRNKDNITVLNKWLKIELTYTSNAIEGNTLTRKETSLAIEENLTSGAKPIRDYLEAINHAKAYDFILQKHKTVNEETILAIHKIILSGIDNENAGFCRSVRVRISGSQTILPNPIKVPTLMKELSDWLENVKEDTIIKAIEAHYKLVTIHPFIDGNGRTSRLLMNLILMSSGYAPIIIRPIDRKRYLSALELRQISEKSETYINFMLNALNRSLKTIIDILDLSKEDISVKRLLTISKFAKLVDLPTSTIRYWVETGKIKPMSYTKSGDMLFSPEQKELVQNKSKN